MICIDCRYVRERPSGIGLVVQQIIERVPGWMPEESFLLLRHPRAVGRLSSAQNVREVVVGSEANGPATMWWLPQVVDLRGVDLFHAPFNILPAGLRMSTVVTVHDVMWLTNPNWAQSVGWWGHVERGFYRHGIWRALRKADHICAISQATRNEIVRLWEPARERTTVLLQAAAGVFRPAVEGDGGRMARVRDAYAGGRRYVLTVGQWVPYKNHGGVIRGFAKAFGSDSEIHLVMVQRLGAGADSLRLTARRHGVEERVHFQPPVGLDDLVALYQGAECLCHPSFVEGFGLPLVEAMASGCPVVTSGRSAMLEVCQEAAEYVEPASDDSIASGLRRVVGDGKRAAELQRQGLERVRGLSWDRYAHGHEAIYRRLLSERRGAKKATW